MTSSLNNRIAPQVIINDQLEQPSVSYFKRDSIDKELNKHENGIHPMIDQSFENSSHSNRINQV